MRKAQAILRLGEKWGKDLEKASEKAMAFGNTSYRSIKSMLEMWLLSMDAAVSSPAPALSEQGQSFLRESGYFSGEARS